MKVKKFTLTKDVNVISMYKLPDDFANDTFYPQEAKEIAVYLVEIDTSKNPSNLILQFGLRNNIKEIPLSIYKTELIFIKDIYCLDTSKKEDFKFNLSEFKILIEGDNDDFTIDFHYSTDQKRPYISVESDRFFSR